MTFPADWTTLPGVSDYLSKIIKNLKDGNSVWLYFPNAPSNFGAWVRSELKHWQWKRLLRRSDLQAEILQSGCVYWVEIESDSSEFRNIFKEKIKSTRFARIGVLVRSNSQKSVKQLRGVEGISVNVWSDFVTSTDSRVLVERIGRSRDWSYGYIDMMSAIVSQLARRDLGLASEYANRGISDILSENLSRNEDIWIAQLQVLFPKIDQFRKEIIRKYRAEWKLPWLDEKAEKEVKNIDNLEIKHLLSQIKNLPISCIESKDFRHLQDAKKYRNKLAHQDVLSWEELISNFGIQVLRIKEPPCHS